MLTITLKPSADANTHKTYNLSYDANGNLTQKQNTANPAEKTSYTWDAADKLIALSQTEGGQTVTASFQYDLFGRRISSTIQQGTPSAQNPPQTVHYLYEGQQALGEIRNQTLSHRLISGLSLDEGIARIAMVGTGNINAQASRQMLTDALNSVIALANGQGTGIANSYGYSPYGQTQSVGPDASGNPVQYTSRENDGTTGLTFYRARYYDPVLKRFISEDPIGLAGGMNKFAYVEGDPINVIDPLGLMGSGGYKIPAKRPDGNPWGWGCGDNGTDHNVPDKVGHIDFTPACRNHDNCYGTCREAKDKCDRNFIGLTQN